jgi:elongation factor Tu
MSAFARTVSPFLRTARAALQQGKSVSPLQLALQRQNGAQFLNAYRTYATATFERTKPHVNIGMLCSINAVQDIFILTV